MPTASSTTVSCPHAPPCPGCPLIQHAYGEQLLAKREHVRAVTTRFPELRSVAVDAVHEAEPIVGYRARAKLVVDGTHIGLFERGGHDVVDIPECRVLEPSLSRVAALIRGMLPLAVPLRAVDLQRSEEGVLVTLVVPDGTDASKAQEEAARIAESSTDIAGIALSHRDEASHQVLGRAPSALWGKGRATLHVDPAGPFHFVAAGGFAQAHPGQQRALLDAIARVIEDHRPLRGARVLDLYSGSGALALSLADKGARVLAAEAYEPASELCRAAAAAQHLDVTARATDVAVTTHEVALDGTKLDAIVVNPPRRGVSPSVRADLGELSAPLLIYVSCEPTTLCRDAADLARRGFALEGLRPYDMMPLTDEVETLAIFRRAAPPLPEVLHADERLIAVVKSPHEPTIPQGEHASSLLGRVRRLDGAEHAVPVHRLDLGTSGVCLFARRPEHAHALSRALALGEKEYIALARGILREKGSVRRHLLERGRPQTARTRYTRRDVVSGHSLISVRPDEGRKHQIRRHLSSLGHPIVGDERYGDPRTNHHFSQRHFLDRTFLHCARILLAREEGELELVAPLAPDLELVLESLRRRE
jgi:23S rRNA (uracil1939-C5)-methyltransferase